MCVKGQEHVEEERKAMSQRIIAHNYYGARFVIEGSKKTDRAIEDQPSISNLLKIRPNSHEAATY